VTRLASGLPKGEGNGLTVLARKLIDNPSRIHVVIALIDCKKISTDVDTGDVEATARIRRIEAVLPEDHPVAQTMLRRSLDKRIGKEVLPYDLEEELRVAFEGIDPDTGEILGGGR
jgi:hypothetical protein